MPDKQKQFTKIDKLKILMISSLNLIYTLKKSMIKK